MLCNRVRSIYNLNVYVILSNTFSSIISKSPNSLICRSLFTSCVSLDAENKEDDSKKKKNKCFITLIGIDGIPKTSTLEAALKISKRRNLQLIKVSDLDARKQNPLYKLLTGAQVLDEDINIKKENKGKTGVKHPKILTFSYKISQNDLNSKINQVLKWLKKNHEVRATISGSASDTSLVESCYQQIESQLKDHGRILQKRNSGHDIKFQVISFKEDKITTNEREPS